MKDKIVEKVRSKFKDEIGLNNWDFTLFRNKYTEWLEQELDNQLDSAGEGVYVRCERTDPNAISVTFWEGTHPLHEENYLKKLTRPTVSEKAIGDIIYDNIEWDGCMVCGYNEELAVKDILELLNR